MERRREVNEEHAMRRTDYDDQDKRPPKRTPLEIFLQLLLLASVILNVVLLNGVGSPFVVPLERHIRSTSTSPPQALRQHLPLSVSLSVSAWLPQASVPAMHAIFEGRHTRHTVLPANWHCTLTARCPEEAHELTPEEIDTHLAINGTVCASQELKELLRYLHNIILVININYVEVARRTAPFLKAVYGRFFDKVVLISREAMPEVGVEARGSPTIRNSWQFAYLHLPKIFARYPNADGFLWTNDDVALNYWQLRHGNKSKIWGFGTPIFIPFNSTLPPEFDDGWSASPSVRYSANQAIAHAELRYIDTYKKSLLPHNSGYIKRVVDCFYVPKRLVESLAHDLIPGFRDYMVMSEVAIPMMLYALENPDAYDPMLTHMTYVWERPLTDPRKYWRPEVAALHPWKLANATLRDSFIRTLGQKDPCLKLMQW